MSVKASRAPLHFQSSFSCVYGEGKVCSQPHWTAPSGWCQDCSLQPPLCQGQPGSHYSQTGGHWSGAYGTRLAGQSILRGLGLVNCQSLSCSSGILISCMTSSCGLCGWTKLRNYLVKVWVMPSWAESNHLQWLGITTIYVFVPTAENLQPNQIAVFKWESLQLNFADKAIIISASAKSCACYITGCSILLLSLRTLGSFLHPKTL